MIVTIGDVIQEVYCDDFLEAVFESDELIAAQNEADKQFLKPFGINATK